MLTKTLCLPAPAAASCPWRSSQRRATTRPTLGRRSVVRAGAPAGDSGPADKQQQRRRTIALASSSPPVEVVSEVWTQYVHQQQAPTRASGGSPFLLPLLVFPLCELPTETLTLPVQEGCYLRMFELVEGSASRLFGATLADPASNSMESVGALCELTHLVRVPDQRMLLVAARVVGRFQAEDVLCSEPFVTVLAHEYADRLPADEWEALQLAAQEQRVWREVVRVASLGDELLDRLSGKLAAQLEGMGENVEILRWSPNSAARGSVPTAAAADTAMLAQVAAGGMLGDPRTLPERTTEHLCQDALRPVSEDGRRERFSFALASALGLNLGQQQQLMYSQSTAERLHVAELVLRDWHSHLAAYSALRDSLPPDEQ